jgi:hypothetical protein
MSTPASAWMMCSPPHPDKKKGKDYFGKKIGQDLGDN